MMVRTLVAIVVLVGSLGSSPAIAQAVTFAVPHPTLGEDLAAAVVLNENTVATERDIRDATIAGSVLRLRPKLMTVSVVMAGLVPILWSTGVGSDIMKPIAAPIIGGMVTSTIHVLIITPVIFYILKLRALRKGTLKMSGMTV